MRALILAGGLQVLLPALLCAQDAPEIVRRAVELDRRNLELSRNYTFLERQEQRRVDGLGKVTETESQTWDVTVIEGSPYRRVVARNDKPLTPREQKKEEEKLQRIQEERRKESKELRARRIAEWERKQERQREPLSELPDAFEFKLAGEETVNGNPTYVIDAIPKAGYRPRSTASSFFPKVKARLWIDKADDQWVKADMETLETVSFAGILMRVAKGSHLTFENTRINQEVWLTKRLAIQGAVRIALIKVLRGEFSVTFSEFKKLPLESLAAPLARP
jgi:hypothetical protein